MGCAERGLLVVGGIFDGEALGINGALVNGTWRPIPSFEGVQIVHECTNAVVDGSRMYFLPQACYFDAQSWCWETFEPLPGPKRDSVACAVLPDRVLVAVGGRVIDETRTTLWDATARVDAYSPATGWATLPELLVPVFAAAVGVINGLLYVAGGAITTFEEESRCPSGGPNSTNRLQIYDPKSRCWSFGPPLTTTRESLCGLVIENLLIVVGGNVQTEPDDPVLFDPSTNQWSELTAEFKEAGLLNLIESTGLVVHDGEIVQIGAGVPRPHHFIESRSRNMVHDYQSNEFTTVKAEYFEDERPYAVSLAECRKRFLPELPWLSYVPGKMVEHQKIRNNDNAWMLELGAQFRRYQVTCNLLEYPALASMPLL